MLVFWVYMYDILEKKGKVGVLMWIVVNIFVLNEVINYYGII